MIKVMEISQEALLQEPTIVPTYESDLLSKVRKGLGNPPRRKTVEGFET